jgi:hypothetical protein
VEFWRVWRWAASVQMWKLGGIERRYGMEVWSSRGLEVRNDVEVRTYGNLDASCKRGDTEIRMHGT